MWSLVLQTKGATCFVFRKIFVVLCSNIWSATFPFGSVPHALCLSYLSLHTDEGTVLSHHFPLAVQRRVDSDTNSHRGVIWLVCLWMPNMLWLVIILKRMEANTSCHNQQLFQPLLAHTHLHVRTHTHTLSLSHSHTGEDVHGHQMLWFGAKRELWVEGNQLMELYAPISPATDIREHEQTHTHTRTRTVSLP